MIKTDGGVQITATRGELESLAAWLHAAAESGRCEPSFLADEGLTSIVIERTVDPC